MRSRGRREIALFAMLCAAVLSAVATQAAYRVDPVAVVRGVMTTPDDRVDLARAKLTFDKLYDPSIDVEAGVRQIDEMARTIREMAGAAAPSRLGLAMLRKYIYDAGP